MSKEKTPRGTARAARRLAGQEQARKDQLIREQARLERLVSTREYYPEFIAGTTGEYHVVEDGDTAKFTIANNIGPREIKAICWEDAFGKMTWVPFHEMFTPPKQRTYPAGRIGETRKWMLSVIDKEMKHLIEKENIKKVFQSKAEVKINPRYHQERVAA